MNGIRLNLFSISRLYHYKLNLSSTSYISNYVLFSTSASSKNEEAEVKEEVKIIQPKFDFKLSSDLEEALNNDEINPKRHPGIMSVKSVRPPNKLQEAAYKVFEEYSSNNIKSDSQRLLNVLRHREIPVEEDVRQKMKSNIENRLEKKSPIKAYLKLLEEEDRQQLINDREKKVNHIYNKNLYNWKPIDYNPYRCVQYLATRFAPEFAALTRIFNEIKIRVPDFKPRSVFDFGSGVGTTTWAVDNMWPGKCWEVLSYDPCDNMNKLSDRLLRGGNPGAKLKKREGGTSFKNYMPYSDSIPYDLVVSAYSMLEVGHLDSRSKMLDVLWRKVAPGGFLVLVEQGSKAGYEIIIQSREILLHTIQQEIDEGFEGGHIVAPCPHEKFCPRYFAAKTSCNFDVKYYDLKLAEEGEVARHENMSYIVFYRGSLNSTLTKYKWPRILKGKSHLSKHVRIPTCTASGTLNEFVATKKRHGKMCYRVCKASSKGDLLPIEVGEYNKCSEILEELNNDDIIK